MPRAPDQATHAVMRRLLHALFGVYALTVFAICVLFSLLATIFVPGLENRSRLVSGAARWSFLLSGLRPAISGLDKLPTQSCVVVANHASYVDGILLKGFLPARFSFVIKGEMRKFPVVNFMILRSGSRFVERYKSAESARDARQIIKAARDGESLAFFPEGTFREQPGVGRFRAGASLAAVKGELPFVPIAISGTRALLGMGRFLPRPVPIRIDILDAIAPDDPAFNDHHRLAEAARQRILAVVDEPDLLAA